MLRVDMTRCLSDQCDEVLICQRARATFQVHWRIRSRRAEGALHLYRCNEGFEKGFRTGTLQTGLSLMVLEGKSMCCFLNKILYIYIYDYTYIPPSKWTTLFGNIF